MKNEINFEEKQRLEILKYQMERQTNFTLYTNKEEVLKAYLKMINPKN